MTVKRTIFISIDTKLIIIISPGFSFLMCTRQMKAPVFVCVLVCVCEESDLFICGNVMRVHLLLFPFFVFGWMCVCVWECFCSFVDVIFSFSHIFFTLLFFCWMPFERYVVCHENELFKFMFILLLWCSMIVGWFTIVFKLTFWQRKWQRERDKQSLEINSRIIE